MRGRGAVCPQQRSTVSAAQGSAQIPSTPPSDEAPSWAHLPFVAPVKLFGQLVDRQGPSEHGSSLRPFSDRHRDLGQPPSIRGSSNRASTYPSSPDVNHEPRVNRSDSNCISGPI